MDKIYFKGLNGIRAIAALIVITFHTDQFFNLFGLRSLGYHETGMAQYGVILFFVLSGYLITYLLLSEKKTFTKIDLSKFYVRRILRIWPIYYLVIIVTAVLILLKVIDISQTQVAKTFFLYSFLLSNFGYAFGLGFVTITPLWSVGVEEQFYAVWPMILNKSKNILHALFVVLIIYMIIKTAFRFFDDRGNLYWLVRITSFDSMALGGIIAYYYFTKNKIIYFLYKPAVQSIAWLFLLVSIFYKPVHVATLFDNEIHSVIYAIIILNVSTNPKSLIGLENKLFNFLGRISYGIYVYHMLIIYLLAYFLKNVIHHIAPTYFQYGVTYLLIYTFTIGIASLSYRYFESRFLSLKRRYSKIHSSN